MNYKEKLKDIKAFVFDVDGVFTDGTVYLLPGENMCRAMSSLDGYAVIKALKQGYKVGIITGGSDPMVKYRFSYLGVVDYYPKSKDKIKDLEHFKAIYNLKDEEILSMGDDIPDREMLKQSHIERRTRNKKNSGLYQSHKRRFGRRARCDRTSTESPGPLGCNR